jgi:hypothetical protein
MHCSKPSFLLLLSGIQHAQKVLTHFSEKPTLTQKYEKETSTLTKTYYYFLTDHVSLSGPHNRII